MSYQPIENYGIIGDLQTAALVGMNGSIDWFCYPAFDSPSVFAAILDSDKGGHFRIAPRRDGVTWRQFYWPDTNVLVTRALCGDGVGEVVDFMPVASALPEGEPRRIVRRVRAVSGVVDFELECRPAFDYARASHDVELTQHGARFRCGDLTLSLVGDHPLQVTGDGAARATLRLEAGEVATFCLLGDEPRAPRCEADMEQLFEDTVGYWREWLGQCTYRGRWRERVERAALTLKLLTYEPTGAIVAAPTCSLPESIGGARNWDYRYTWIRDSAFTVYALLRIGFRREAEGFVRWLNERCRELDPDGSLRVMYGIDGRHELQEAELAHLDGYRGSRPVRIGNGAHDQRQLDIYGELLDSVYLYNKHVTPIGYDLWQNLRRMVEWVVEHWREQDRGIWEVRGAPQDFVYSKLMCWVALDRALRLADKRSFPAPRARWLEVRDEIYEQIMSRGYDRQLEAFTQSYGSGTLDAANLLMPLTFFVSPTDPRMLGTLDAIGRLPRDGGLTANSLVRRYAPDFEIEGVRGEEGTFNMCTFWLVEALTRAGHNDRRRLEEARLVFEQMLNYANHLGLYAEETGHRGEALGNFPQAFTHLALISAAFNLDRAFDGGR